MLESSLPPGVAFGERYRIERVLGRGTLATVYLVRDERLGVDRALKVPHPAILALDGLVHRFAAEVQTAVHLDHPNIVRIFEVGRDEKVVPKTETLFVVMEFVPGGSLRDYLTERGWMPMPSALVAMRGVLRGLQRAHGKGVLHREVKPSNVLIGKGGIPKLADFGFARLLELPPVKALVGGKLSPFLAPEQRSGARPSSLASDIYGAGATLYALVSGEDPNGLDDPTVRRRLLSEVDDPVCDIIDHATQPDPDERYGSTTEFLDAIEAASSQIGNAAFSDQGLDMGSPRGLREHISLSQPSPVFKPPADLAPPPPELIAPADLVQPGEEITDPLPQVERMAPPLVLEHAAPRAQMDSPITSSIQDPSQSDRASTPRASDDPASDEEDSVDSFDVRELGLPLREEHTDAAPIPVDRADDIASSLRTQRVPAPTPEKQRHKAPIDLKRKIILAGAAAATALLFLVAVALTGGSEDPPQLPTMIAVATPEAAPSPAEVAPEPAPVAAPASLPTPSPAPDARDWKPPADPDSFSTRLRAAPWM